MPYRPLLKSLLLAALTLSACKPADEPPEPPRAADAAPAEVPKGAPPVNPALADAKGTLTVWLAADYAGAPLYADLNRAFEAAYPGVKVKLLGVPWGSMPTKVKTAIIGGKPPDVAHYHPFSLGAEGFAEPLDDLWKAWGADAEFLPGALEDATWRHVRYGMPLDINCTVLVYNKTHFKQAGLAEPGDGYTFAKLQSDLGKLTTKDRHGIGLSTNSWHSYAWVLANGGDLLAERGGRVKVTFTDPKTVEAVRYLADLGFKHHFGPTPTTKVNDYEDATKLFTMGKVSVIYTGPWDFEVIRKNAPGLEFGVARFPAGADGGTPSSVQGGGGLFVPKGAAHRALAFEWMKWAVSDPYARRLAREQGRFPVKRALYDEPGYQKDPAIRTFVGALPLARPFKLEAYPQANQAFADAVKASFYGADPAAELAKAGHVAQLAIDAVEGQ